MTSYLDLTVVIDPGSDGVYNVRVDSSEGQGRAILKLPPRWDNNAGADVISRGIGTVAGDGSAAPPRSLSDYGSELFTALFQGEVGDRLVATISRANYMPDTGVRIRLSMDLRAPGMAEVASLPWELMCRPGERAFVVSKKTALVRGLDTAQPLNPMPFVAPLRILVLMSNPAGTQPLGLDAELDKIKAGWAKLPGVEVDYVRPVRKRIIDQLDLHNYHVIHYMGHGDFAAHTGGALVMETEDGQPDMVSADDFAMMLDDEPLRLVFLNACKTGTTGSTEATHPYAGVATALIRERIPAVVAMQFPISDSAAISFAETFYQRIAAGSPVDVAVAEGRKVIYSNQHAEWATPVLYMRSDDGNLFTPADVGVQPAPQLVATLAPATAATADDWGAGTGDRLKLFLATPDQDREKLHQQLAAALGARSDCAVVDRVPIDTANYGATVDTLLRNADLCVHLLSANAGRRIDVDDGQPLNTFTLQQLDVGRKLAKSQLVLMTAEDHASIGNAAYKVLVDELEALPRDKARFEFVVADRNRILDAVIAKLEELRRARQAALAPAASNSGRTAFVDAHEIDQDRAIDLLGFLEGHDVSTAINTGTDEVKDPAVLDDTVRHTGLYVIVAGKVDPEWVRNRKMAIVKSAARTRSKVLVAKYPTADASLTPAAAPRVEISSFNDSDRSWVDALFADSDAPRT